MSSGEAVALALALLWLAAQRARGPAGLTWPVPEWLDGSRRLRPVISSDYQGGRHRGVDILYRRDGVYMAPEGTPIVSVSSGVVEWVRQSPRGWGVLIDHRDGKFKSFYQHLASVAVTRGQAVSEGQQIGIMGIDPLDAQQVRHLHFELWGWPTGESIDPGVEMKTWRVTTWKIP